MRFLSLRFLHFTVPCAAAATALLLTPAAHAQQNRLTNGNFESGSLSGWSVARNLQPPSESLNGTNDTTRDNWYADAPGTGTPATSPTGGFPNGLSFPTAQNTNPGGGGSTYAVTTSDNPSALALYQSFTLPAILGARDRVFIGFDMFVNDQTGFAGGGNDPAVRNLDFRGGAPAGSSQNDYGFNQHARVDLLFGSTTDFFSTSTSTVRANLYDSVDDGADNSTAPTSSPNPYTRYRFDVTSLVAPGQTYYLRFANVNNSGAINQGVDNVSVITVEIPEPSTMALLVPVGLGLGFIVRRRRLPAQAA